MILVLLGPSGSGKTKFEHMCESVGFKRVISHTTRPRRVGDRDFAYYFISEEKFDAMLENGEFIEHTNYCGNKYGISKSALVAPCILVVEPEGLRQLKKAFGDVPSIYFDVPEEIRFQRCISRGDTREYALNRLEKDRGIFNASLCDEVTYVFKNNTIEDLQNLLFEVQSLLQ